MVQTSYCSAKHPESLPLTLIRYAMRSYMLGFSFRMSCFMRSVALPSSCSPRRISSKSRRDSSMGRSLQGLSLCCSRLSLISSGVWFRV